MTEQNKGNESKLNTQIIDDAKYAQCGHLGAILGKLCQECCVEALDRLSDEKKVVEEEASEMKKQRNLAIDELSTLKSRAQKLVEALEKAAPYLFDEEREVVLDALKEWRKL